MAHVEESCRKRKMKFEPIELEVLVQEANNHIHELQQKNLTLSRRNAIWEAVCARVNAVGQTRRTTDEIKRRWQDLLRRTKQKIAHNKSGGGAAQDKALSPIEQHVLMTFCNEQMIGVHGSDSPEPGSSEHGESSVGRRSPPQSSRQAEPTGTCAEPRRLASDVIDEELLQPLEDGLQDIAQEVRAVASVVRALRRDTRAIVRHTRQLVDAVSGLTVAINTLTRAVEGGAERVERSFNPGCASPEQSLLTRGHQRKMRKRKK